MAERLVALRLELRRELLGFLARAALDAHLPRREALVELLLLPRLGRRFVVPALLGVEPVLDLARLRLDAVRAQLGLDDGLRLLGVGLRAAVDEDRLVVDARRIAGVPSDRPRAPEPRRSSRRRAALRRPWLLRPRSLSASRRSPCRVEPNLPGWTGARSTSRRPRGTRRARAVRTTSGSSCSLRTPRGRPGCAC